ncbi:glycosyltransferase family 25 protein [Haemophilus pittmaniae]|nr:glycosyltransferase family 25 protein [Haemophilus pittmaniae]SNV82943.1 putative UDP-glcNAc--lipooligosaccharide N-acetylglucosaminyl glycosyltransferase [Haemophilus pittmaniae]
MNKYLISLDKDVERRELFFAQAETADFHTFSAFNTMQKAEDELLALFDFAKFAQHYSRHVTKGEIGCTLSHLGVYRLIVEDAAIGEEDYALICEDDALFNPEYYQQALPLLVQQCKEDIVLIGQSKIADFADIELEINYPTTFSALCQHAGSITYGYPYKSYFAGTVGYLIKKSAARKLLAPLSQGKPFWLADDFPLFETFGIYNNVVRPLLVIENPKLASNLQSARGSIANNWLKKCLKYPAKKCLAIQRNWGK